MICRDDDRSLSELVLESLSLKPMKTFILILWIGFLIGIQGCSHGLGPTGLIHSPDSKIVSSGVYLGKGFLLTNAHVVGSFPADRETLKMPTGGLFCRSVEIPVERVLYHHREIELAIIKLAKTVEDSHRVFRTCLSPRLPEKGDPLTVISTPSGRFPPVSASITVIDDRPILRRYPAPPINGSAQYSVMTIAGLIPKDEAKRVGPGSSGGAVLNTKGELVGLVWAGRTLNSGDFEVWITPVSSWMDHLRHADITKEDRSRFLELVCNPNFSPE